jgi:hypothetical protein
VPATSPSGIPGLGIDLSSYISDANPIPTQVSSDSPPAKYMDMHTPLYTPIPLEDRQPSPDPISLGQTRVNLKLVSDIVRDSDLLDPILLQDQGEEHPEIFISPKFA